MSFGRSDDPCYRRSFFVCKGDGVQLLEKRDPFPQKNNSFDTFFIGFLACVQTSPISFVARVHAGNRFPESRFLFPKYSSLNSTGGFRRGEGTAPPPPPPPPHTHTHLILGPNWGPKARNIFLGDRAPPYLKVRIRHWKDQCRRS